MAKDSPMQPNSYAVADKPAKKNSSFHKFLGLSKSKDNTLKQHSNDQSPTGHTIHFPIAAPLDVSSTTTTPPSTLARPPKNIFTDDVPHPGIKTPLPHLQERIEKTEQLVYCNALLLQQSSSEQTSNPSKEPVLTPIDDQDGSNQQGSNLDKAESEWLGEINKDPMEQDQLRWLVTRMVEEFVLDPIKDSAKIAEIVALGPVLDSDHYRKLLSSIIGGFEDGRILDVELLQGLVQLVQANSPGHLLPDDLINILRILRIRLEGTHKQTTEHYYHLTLAVSRVLDVMAEHDVKDLNRVEEHEPLSGVLSGLKGSSDPYLMYQACYAFQALQYVPGDETALQAIFCHSKGVASGLMKISGLVKLDLNMVIEGLADLKEAAAGVYEVAMPVYEGLCSVMENGRGVLENLQDGYGSGSGKKRPWYAAIRAAYAFVHAGQLKGLNRFIYVAPCRHDALFQWGICQLLGEIASDTIWDTSVRQQAVGLLGELYKNDPEWGQDESVKTCVLNIIHQLSTIENKAVSDSAHTLLKESMQDQGPTTRPLTR